MQWVAFDGWTAHIEVPFIEMDASKSGVGAVLSQRSGEITKMYIATFYFHKQNSLQQKGKKTLETSSWQSNSH